MTVPILGTRALWECPSCSYQMTTEGLNYTTIPGHSCSKYGGLTVTMVKVPKGEDWLKRGHAEHRVNRPEDYVSERNGRVDGEGKPIASVNTVRDEGRMDCHVYVPTAVAKLGS